MNIRSKPLQSACTAAVFSLLGACASHPYAESPAVANLPGKEACFFTRTVFSWTVLNDSTLIVDAPTSQTPYLVKLMAPVPGLGGLAAERLGFQSGPRMGMFCNMDSIFVRAPGGGPPPWREPAIAVRAITPAQAKDLIATAQTPVERRPEGGVANEAAGSEPASRR